MIEQRLGKVNQRLRDLQAFKRELVELRDSIRAREGTYCYYLESASASATKANV